MKKQTLIALVVAAVAAVVLVMVTSRDRGGAATEPTPDATEIGFDLAAAASVRIAGPDGGVTLEAENGRWTVAERGGFAADAQKLATLLRAMDSLRPVQTMTVSEPHLGRLGLAARDAGDAAPEATGTTLRVSDAEGQVLTEWIVGSEHMPEQGGRTGRYFRRPDSQTVHLALEPLRVLSSDPSDWIRKSPLMPDLDVIEVSSAPVGREQEGWTIGPGAEASRPDSGVEDAPTPAPTPEFQGLAPGESVRDGAVAELIRLLERLRFEDVVPPGSDRAGEFQVKAVATVTSRDGTSHRIEIGDPGAGDMTPLRVTTTPGGQTDGSPDAGRPTTDPTLYLVPTWSIGRLADPRSEWIEPDREETPDGPDDAPTG